MTRKNLSLIVFITLIFTIPLYSQSGPGYRILVPTGNNLNGYPVLKLLDKNDPRFALSKKIFEETFVQEIVHINGYIQQFLLSEQRIAAREPVYLLISGRMGGYPMHGFYLKKDGRIIDKTHCSYVDLQEVEKNYGSLSSITQIFPHEQVHIFYSQLTGINPALIPSYSSDIHYYSIITDYFKAFNEGFAESFENVSRDNEKDSAVVQGVRVDIYRLKKSIDRKSGGFERDNRWPLRAGFYRATMLLWYQQLENYKRSEWSNENIARYLPGDPGISDPEQAIHYRNACVTPDTSRIRNLAQDAATEGVICTFFTRLMESDLKEHYASRRFYFPFVTDTNLLKDPQNYFSPLENQTLKELYIVRKYLGTPKENDSPLFLFINGYTREFPAEKDKVLGIFHDVTSQSYMEQAPSELWILNKDHRHTFLVMAPFGGAKASFYTFNLNTAGPEDLMTLKEMNRREALKIVHYRDSAGCFSSFDDLQLVPGLDKKTAQLISMNKLDPNELKKLGDNEGMNYTKIIALQLKPFGYWILFITLITSIILYLAFYLRKKPPKAVLLMFLRTIGKVSLFVLLILAALILGMEPFLIFGVFSFLVIMLNFLRTRKKNEKRLELILSTLIIVIILGYSII